MWFALLMSLSFPAFADESLGKPAYQALQEYYQAARQVPTPDDFDEAGANSRRQCVLISPDKPDPKPQPPIFIDRLTRVEEGARVLKLFIGACGADQKSRCSRDVALVSFDFVRLETTETDLVVTHNAQPGRPGTPFVAYLRKNGPYAAYKLVRDEKDHYGYCW